jgi:hypothetical protein
MAAAFTSTSFRLNVYDVPSFPTDPISILSTPSAPPMATMHEVSVHPAICFFCSYPSIASISFDPMTRAPRILETSWRNMSVTMLATFCSTPCASSWKKAI